MFLKYNSKRSLTSGRENIAGSVRKFFERLPILNTVNNSLDGRKTVFKRVLHVCCLLSSLYKGVERVSLKKTPSRLSSRLVSTCFFVKRTSEGEEGKAADESAFQETV